MTDISRPARRAVEKHGEPVTLKNWSQTGTDSYGDPTFGSPSTTSTTAIVDVPNATSEKGEEGQEEVVDAVFRIATTEAVHAPNETDVRATVVVRDDTGAEYKVQSATATGDGLYEVETERAEQ